MPHQTTVDSSTAGHLYLVPHYQSLMNFCRQRTCLKSPWVVGSALQDPCVHHGFPSYCQGQLDLDQHHFGYTIQFFDEAFLALHLPSLCVGSWDLHWSRGSAICCSSLEVNGSLHNFSPSFSVCSVRWGSNVSLCSYYLGKSAWAACSCCSSGVVSDSFRSICRLSLPAGSWQSASSQGSTTSCFPSVD